MLGSMTGPLAGFTVGITGHRRWEEQAEMLARRGAAVVHGPVMHTGLLHDAEATARATEVALDGRIDVIVLTTGIGTRSWFGVAESAGTDDRLRAAAAAAVVVARGPKARSAATGNGLEVAWQAPGETSAEVLAHLRDLGVAGARVVVQRDGGDPLLARALGALDAEVVDVPVYAWQVPSNAGPAIRLLDAACDGRIHALTFTCAYGVDSAFTLASDPAALVEALSRTTLAVAVGPVCAAALRRRGVERVVEPRRARLGAMVQALVRELSETHRVLRHDGHELHWQGDLVVGPEGRRTALTPGEARILSELVRRSPAVVPKADLLGEGVDAHAAVAAVARLRAKLGPLADGIRAVPRRGYASTLEVTSA
jgi:uroporphyrinogen-III synthase